jgi:hypothetical protein
MTTTTQEQQPNNVLAFQTAISAGYEPRDYSYEKDDIPTGEYHVQLDFMIWAKKLPAIDLYCTIKQTGQKIRLTVFLDKERSYRLHHTNVAELPFGSTLVVQVERNTNDNPTLNKITRLPGKGSPKGALKT